MTKIGLILEREYRSRLQSRSFLVITFLAPLFYALLLIGPVLIQQAGQKTTYVEVYDPAQQFFPELEDTDEINFQRAEQDLDAAREAVRSGRQEAMILYIPRQNLDRPGNIKLISGKEVGPGLVGNVERQINDIIEARRMAERGISPEELEAIKPSVEIDTMILSGEGSKRAHAGAAAVAGFAGGFLIYIFIFLYGSFVLRGVQEEKTNRVVEIILSSVRPIELMLGKIGGVLLVGFTQLAIWAVLLVVLTIFGAQMLGMDAMMDAAQNSPQAQQQALQEAQTSGLAADILTGIGSIDFGQLFLAFVFYFLGGYLLYASLYAAIAAAVDDQADLNQFMFPISIPIILSIIALPSVIQQPHGPVAFVMSMVPLTAPVVMLARIPFDVPWFEVLLSALILISFVAATLGIGAKVYRVGILWYGKKMNYKELWRWLKA